MVEEADIEVMCNWKKSMSIHNLKIYAKEKGYSAVTVSESYGHAHFKKLDY